MFLRHARTFAVRSGRSKALVCIGASLAAGFVAYDKAQAEDVLLITEPTTGFHFPQKIGNEKLLATAVRTVTWFQFVTYALGFYVEDTMFQRIAAEPEKSTREVLENLLASDCSKSVKLIPYREIDVPHFTSSLSMGMRDSLQESVGLQETKQILAEFSKCFQVKAFPPETEIDFSWLPGNNFRIMVDGVPVITFQNSPLCKAFFSMYLGEPARVVEIKQRVEEGIRECQFSQEGKQ